MSLPVYRYLRGYCLDPGFSTRLDTAGINVVVYQIPYEKLTPGPRGEYIDVLDYDPATDCWYEPVDLTAEEIASQNGLAPSEGNPQFHQQSVYAVAMKTIRHFESALGRKIIWIRTMDSDKKAPQDVRLPREFVPQLRIYPHALRASNAYYDPDKVALLFGYFSAADQIQGANYPGGLVFTCLSPDIVAHETTHAILDSLHHRYIEDTNPDVAAFHEGFADIVALLQRFTFSELVEHQLFKSGGRLDRYNVFGELATQFGEALEGNRGALRSMIGRWQKKDDGSDEEEWVPLKASPADYAAKLEAHERGAVLVATIFDAFQRIYAFRTADLLRIATNGTGRLAEGSISRDLVHRLADEASQIAMHLLHICIRALDYCPPNDISFGDYLRALITADLDIAPEDENGYRLALIEAFRARGIFPDRVNTLSIDSLSWSAPDLTDKEKQTLGELTQAMRKHIQGLVETKDRAALYESTNDAREQLERQLEKKTENYSDREWESFLTKLGLTSKPVSELFGPKVSAKVKFTLNGRPNNRYKPKIEILTIRPAFRTGREGRQVEQVVVTLTQRVSADVGLAKPMVFRGGCSIILGLGNLNEVQYVVQKNIKSYRRFERQIKHQRGEGDAPPALSSAYVSDDRPWRINFSLLHSH